MDKIQELTSKLYSEGVEKGKEEAGRIVAEANATAVQIVEKAKKTAENMVATAQKETAELKAHTEAELKLYASQASEALKSEIANLITGRLATQNVKAAIEERSFMQKLIVEMVQNWAKEEKLTVGVEQPEALKSFLSTNARALLDKGLRIETVNGIGTGFTVAPEDGSYKVRFGEEEFINYFKEFLRPQIRKLLF